MRRPARQPGSPPPAGPAARQPSAEREIAAGCKSAASRGHGRDAAARRDGVLVKCWSNASMAVTPRRAYEPGHEVLTRVMIRFTTQALI